MFSNIGLDVFIGLVFIFLLYSLLGAIIQEIIAHWLDLRARMLIKSIRVMLDDREESSSNRIVRLFQHFARNFDRFYCPLKKNEVSRVFYQHPSVKYLAQSGWKSKPAYISAHAFALTFIKILRGNNYDGTEPQMNAIYRTLFETKTVSAGEGKNFANAPIGPETLSQIRQIYVDAQKDIDRFKALIEQWYDELQDRTTGWYKKQSQIILFFIGLVIAIVFNADTFAITNILSKDKKAREELVNLAINSQGRYDTIVKQLTKVRLKDSTVEVVGRQGIADTAIVYDTIRRFREHDTLMLTNEQLKEAYNTVLNDIKDANSILGLGRSWKDSCKSCQEFQDSIIRSNLPERYKQSFLQFLSSGEGKEWCENDCIQRGRWLQYHPLQTGGLVTILGWILTALAISLGAPFWFDLLNKIIRLRSSGPKPKDDPPGGLPPSKDNAPGSSPTQRVG